MSAVTTRRAPKSWSWSYSKLKNFETCAKRHFHIDISRDVKEPEGEALLWGNQVHAALEARLGKNTPLPVAMQEYEPWAQRVAAGTGELFVEQQLAIKSDLTMTGWRSNDAWYRAKVDVLRVNGPVALAVDWKTGAVKEDSVQLALASATIFAAYPKVQIVRSTFVWLKEDADTVEDFTRAGMAEIWVHLWPRIQKLKEAHDGQNYPPKPGPLCRRWCPVTQCPHHGG